MKLEELLGQSADDLEKMTDVQLLEVFKPFLSVCRAEKVTNPAIRKGPIKRSDIEAEKASRLQKKQMLLEQFGIDLGDI